MSMRLWRLIIVLVMISVGLVFVMSLKAQVAVDDLGVVSGSFQLDAQLYRQDSLIGAQDIPEEEIAYNGYLNLIYTRGNFFCRLAL